MAALKSLSDNPNISGISVLASRLSFFIQVEVFLVLALMSDFLVKPGHFFYYVLRLWILFTTLVLADTPLVEKGEHRLVILPGEV